MNLEELESDLKRLPNEYIKIEIDNKIKNLKDLTEANPTLSNADKSYKIKEDVLEPLETKTYELRLWMDEKTPTISEVMNSTIESKITITSTYQNTIVIPYLDNQKGEMPKKVEKYEYERYECNEGVTLNWENEEWEYTITKETNKQSVCKLYFKTTTYEVVLYSESTTFENNKVLNNLIKNGSFENDLNNWDSFNSSNGNITTDTYNRGQKSLYIDDKNTTEGYWLTQRLNKQPKMNDLLYQGVSAKIKTFNTSAFRFGFSFWKTSEFSQMVSDITLKKITNGFEHFSTYYKVDISNLLYSQVGSGLVDIVGGYIDDIYVINLTETFGLGKEPAQEWVDKYIPYFDTSANIAVEKIEKLETKTFPFYNTQEVNVECQNANYQITNNTLEISNASNDVYCILKKIS